MSDVAEKMEYSDDFLPADGDGMAEGMVIGGVSASVRLRLDGFERTNPVSRGNSSDDVGLYLADIGQYPLLKADEEVELAQRIEAGRDAMTDLENELINPAAARRLQRRADSAKEVFIQCNLRLVVSIAKRYPELPGMDLLDLIQEGNLGLEHAVDKFDWHKGFKFSTYATFWIRQAIGRALDQKASLIRLPGGQGTALRAALKAAGGDEEDLSEEHAGLFRLVRPSSLNRVVGDEGQVELGDLLPSTNVGPEEAVLSVHGMKGLGDLLDVLEPELRKAVILRFGLDDGRKRSYREVGEAFGFTAEAARRRVRVALNKLREEAATYDPDEFV